MLKQFMPELSAKDRMIVLQQNADKAENKTYQKPLTDEEKTARRLELTENSIELFDLREKKKEASKVFKIQIDPLEKANTKLLTEIRTGQASVEGIIFHMANHEDGMMEFYDGEGYLIESRRLLPAEKQGNLMRAM